jgi:hypothetical protein
MNNFPISAMDAQDPSFACPGSRTTTTSQPHLITTSSFSNKHPQRQYPANSNSSTIYLKQTPHHQTSQQNHITRTDEIIPKRNPPTKIPTHKGISDLNYAYTSPLPLAPPNQHTRSAVPRTTHTPPILPGRRRTADI